MPPASVKPKINFIDNLRVLLMILVVAHHTFITYGAPGGWYYKEPTTIMPALIAMTLFVATNQAFFMGFFFFLSALFTEPSYIKKGTSRFMVDRLKRLGIPLLFYSFILGPVMNFLVYRFGEGKTATFMQYLGGYDDWIDPGVLWFVAALLLFTCIYVLLMRFGNRQPKPHAFPRNAGIFVFALSLGIISYLVRIVFPVGWVLRPLGFQLGHFPQYICMFTIGIIASRNNWLGTITFKTGKRWLFFAAINVFIMFPAIFVLARSPLDTFQGHGTWQSFLASVWEQLTGISIMVAITAIAKYKWNYTTPLLKKMSRAAYATYIFHPLLVIGVCLLLKPWHVDPVIKLLVAVPCAVVTSFSLAWLITRLPVARDIV